MSIFSLIDEALSATPGSELNFRFAYTSSVTSAGRDYDLDQRGYSPGIAYYHRTGLYADLSGYWSPDITPSYNPTILSVGYLGSFKKNISYSFDYEKWFFNPQDTSINPLSNSFGASATYDLKWGFLNLDYSYLFGQESSHRIISTLTGNIKLGKFWKFNNVSLYPSASILFGNGTVTILRITEQTLRARAEERITRITTFENLSTSEKAFARRVILVAFNNGIITQRERNSLLLKTINDETLNEADRRALRSIASGTFFVDEYIEENQFGLLNYAFTLPLAFSTNRITFLLSYTYSLPVSLPDEEFLDIGPIGYFAASINYRLPFSK